MKYQIVVLFSLIALALAATTTPAAPAAPADQDDFHAETLRFETENNGVDKYNFA